LDDELTTTLEEETNSLALITISRERLSIKTLTSVYGPSGELWGFVLRLTTPPENISKLDYTLQTVQNGISTLQQQPANLLESVIPSVADYQYRVKNVLTVENSSIINIMQHQAIVPIIATEPARLVMTRPAFEILRTFVLPEFQGTVSCHPLFPTDVPNKIPRGIKHDSNIYVRSNNLYSYGLVLIDLLQINTAAIGGDICDHPTAISSFLQPGSSPEQHWKSGEVDFLASMESQKIGCMLHGTVTFRGNISSNNDLQLVLNGDKQYIISPLTPEGYITYNHLTYVLDTDSFRRTYNRQQLINILTTTANYPSAVAEEKFLSIAVDVTTIFRTDVFQFGIIITPGYHRGESVLQAHTITPSSITTLCLQNRLHQAKIL
jgi:hypothetical protein